MVELEYDLLTRTLDTVIAGQGVKHSPSPSTILVEKSLLQLLRAVIINQRREIQAAKEMLESDEQWAMIETEKDLPTESGEYLVTILTPSGPYVTTCKFYAFWNAIPDSGDRHRRLRLEMWLPSSGQHILAWRHTPKPYTPEMMEEKQ